MRYMTGVNRSIPVWTLCHWRMPQIRKFESPTVSNNDTADCELLKCLWRWLHLVHGHEMVYGSISEKCVQDLSIFCAECKSSMTVRNISFVFGFMLISNE
jgi:hypothetical protein